jgi:hypothetical protein
MVITRLHQVFPGGDSASDRFLVVSAVLFFIASIIFFFPGSIGWDATAQWYDARTGHITSHHPVFMSFVWHWLDLILPGPGLFLVAEQIFFWIAIASLLIELRPSRLAAVGACVVLSCNPFVLAHSALVIKDVMGGNLALLALAMLLRYPRSPHRLRLVILAFAVLAFAGLFRFQFWLLALPAMAAIGVVERGAGGVIAGARQAVVAVVTMALCVGITQFVMNATLDVRPSTDRNARQVLLFDIGAVVALHPEIDLQPLADSGIDVALLRARAKAAFLPYPILSWTECDRYGEITDQIGDALHESRVGEPNPLRQLTIAEYTRQWTQMLRAVPLLFLETRAAALVRLVGVGGSAGACWPLTVVGFLGRPAEYWAELNGKDLTEPWSATLLRARIFPAATFLFRPVTYLLASAAICVLWWRSARRR